MTVLDFGAVEVHPGGAYTERVHTVVEARDQRAVDRVGEVTVPEGGELILARTVKRGGAVLHAEAPLGDKRTLSLPGLEPGDFAEWEWLRTVPARGPAVPGFAADPFFFQADMPLWRSTYVVRAPVAVGLELDAHHMTAEAPRREGDDLRVRVTREDVPPRLPEPNAPGDEEALPFVQAGAGPGQEALARAMGDALLDLFRPTREIAALAEAIRAAVPEGARREGALVRTAYRRVAKLVQGEGGFDESAGSILSRGRGNRTVLLKAVLDALGVRARLALVRDFRSDPAPYRFPRLDRGAYAVLRVEQASGAIWLDPTLRETPFGLLPPAVRGMEALVLPEPGEEVVRARTPVDAGSDRRRTVLQVTVDEGGGAVVEGCDEYLGIEGAALRAGLARIDAAARRQAAAQALARSFRAPSLIELRVEGEEEPEAPLVVRWRLRVERWARLEPGRALVDTALFPARLAARFLQLPERQERLLVASDERTELEATVRLPAGWRAQAQPTIDVAGPHGAYRREERAEGNGLVRRDAFQLRAGRIDPSAYATWAAFARAVDEAQERPMVFEAPAGMARR